MVGPVNVTSDAQVRSEEIVESYPAAPAAPVSSNVSLKKVAEPALKRPVRSEHVQRQLVPGIFRCRGVVTKSGRGPAAGIFPNVHGTGSVRHKPDRNGNGDNFRKFHSF